MSNKPDFIIVLGTTYSGSQAIFDYLSLRKDLYDPMIGTEYQLPQMPNGLMTLEAISGKSFHAPTVDYVIKQFQNNISKLSRPPSRWKYGKNYTQLLPTFENAINHFVNEITKINIPLKLEWKRLVENDFKYFLSKLKYKIGFNEKVAETSIICTKEELIYASQKLHKNIFLKDSNKLPVLLNQAGSGWNPVESTKYFLNRKIILVNRDPRDQFVELKQYKKASDVNSFIYWYKEMQKRIKNADSNFFVQIQFEDFVINHMEEINSLCNYLSIDKKILSQYESKNSMKNIGKYTKFLNNKERELIEKNLSEYLYV